MFTVFQDSKYFKMKGLPQESASHFYLNRTKELYRAEDLFIGSDFHKRHSAAYTSEELNQFIPSEIKRGSKTYQLILMLERSRSSVWLAKLYDDGNIIAIGSGSSELDAKSWLIRDLLKKKLFKNDDC